MKVAGLISSLNVNSTVDKPPLLLIEPSGVAETT